MQYQTQDLRQQGQDAEFQVSQILQVIGGEYKTLNNIILKTKKGTTQIDHIVLSPYGVFVIETKSHKGYIHGNIEDKYWTQTLKKDGELQTFEFYSPYLQNEGHLKTLYRVLGFDYTKFCGIVCFTADRVNLDNVVCTNVCRLQDLSHVIYEYNKPILTSRDLLEMEQILFMQNLRDYLPQNQHSEYVKSVQEKILKKV